MYEMNYQESGVQVKEQYHFLCDYAAQIEVLEQEYESALRLINQAFETV